MSLAAPVQAEKRTLRLFNTHTHETITVTYKKNGKYIPSALRELNRFLRDWRRNEATKMDPQLFDLVWEVYKKAGGSKPIHVVSAYRSPATNGMLRSRSRGVARKSQHMKGRAMDFFIPGVNLSKLRAAGLRKEVGGVGYYPNSGSPFVHMDTARVRHWPRMTRKQLASVFPDGKTVHIPSDGKPMPRYEQALAELKRRGGGGAPVYARENSKPSRRDKTSAVQVASSGNLDAVEDDDEDIMLMPGSAPRSASNSSGGNPLSGIVSRITGRNDGPTPPAEIPAQSDEKPAQAETPPESVPQSDPDAAEQPVLVAATPLAKPRQAVPPVTVAADQATPPPSRFMLAAAAPGATPLPPAQPAVAVAAPPPASPFGSPDLRKAPVSDNPADYVLASLPPATRSPGAAGDPVEAANSVIAGRKPAARPEIDTDQPPMLAYADANPTLPLEKRNFADFVSSLPRTSVRPEAPAAAEQPKRYAALNPTEPTAASDKEPVRAMPLIGDLRSLLDMTGPFDAGTQFASVGKFLTTSTTTRTQLFADMRHPSLGRLGRYLEKPQRVLRTTFAQGFELSELRTDRFTGTAIGVIRSVYTP